jgi:hypothetical protein
VTMQTCARKIFACVDGGANGPIKRAQMGSEDPHRRKRNYYFFLHYLPCDLDKPLALYMVLWWSMSGWSMSGWSMSG